MTEDGKAERWLAILAPTSPPLVRDSALWSHRAIHIYLYYWCAYFYAFLPNKLSPMQSAVVITHLFAQWEEHCSRIYHMLNKHVLITECFQSWTENSQLTKTAFQRQRNFQITSISSRFVFKASGISNKHFNVIVGFSLSSFDFVIIIAINNTYKHLHMTSTHTCDNCHPFSLNKGLQNDNKTAYLQLTLQTCRNCCYGTSELTLLLNVKSLFLKRK